MVIFLVLEQSIFKLLWYPHSTAEQGRTTRRKRDREKERRKKRRKRRKRETEKERESERETERETKKKRKGEEQSQGGRATEGQGDRETESQEGQQLSESKVVVGKNVQDKLLGKHFNANAS